MKYNKLKLNKMNKKQVLKRMIKNGNNPEESKRDIEENYDYAVSCYKEATVGDIARIIKVLSI